MKRLFYFAGVALLLVGCQKDNLGEIKNAEESASKGGKVEVSVAAGYGDTKAALGEADGTAMPINWEESDALGVFFDSGFDYVDGVSVFPYDSLSEGVDLYDQLPDVNVLRLTEGAGTKNGTFAGSLSPTPSKTDNYYAYYPFQHYVENPNGWNGRGTGYAFRVGSFIINAPQQAPALDGYATLALNLPAEQDGKSVGFMTAVDQGGSFVDGLNFQFKQLLPLLKFDIDPALINEIDSISFSANGVESKATTDYSIDLYQKSVTDLIEVSDYSVTSSDWTKVQVATATEYDFQGFILFHLYRHSASKGWEVYLWLSKTWLQLSSGEGPGTPTELQFAWSLNSHLRLNANSEPAGTPNDFENIEYVSVVDTLATYGEAYYIAGAETETVLDDGYTWPEVEDSYALTTTPTGGAGNVAGTFYAQFMGNAAYPDFWDLDAKSINVKGNGSSSYTMAVPEFMAYTTPVVAAPVGVTDKLSDLESDEVEKTLKKTTYAYKDLDTGKNFDAEQLANFISNDYVIYTKTDAAPAFTISRKQTFSTVKPYKTLTVTEEATYDGYQPTITVTLNDGTKKTYEINDLRLEGGKLYVKTIK